MKSILDLLASISVVSGSVLTLGTGAVAISGNVSAERETAACRFVNDVEYYLASLTKADHSCQNLFKGKMQRLEVRTGDRGWQGDQANHNERSELVTERITTKQKQLLFASGTDAWVSYSMRILPGAPILSRYALVGQMQTKADPDDILPPSVVRFVLGATQDEYVPIDFFTTSDPLRTTKHTQVSVKHWAGKIKRGAWTNIVMRVRSDPFGEGQLDLWVNGEQQLKLKDIPIGISNEVDGIYWQYGIYRQENRNTLAVEYANMEQGPASLAARVARPLPIPQ